jgi:ATP-dependent protease ClpP protease subunit
MNAPRNSAGRWYNIQNRATGPTQVLIYGDIGDFGISASDFVNDLKNLSGDLEIHINTNGGVVSDGVTIHNAIKRHNGAKTGIVDGYAASIGSVIAMACDQVLMAPGSMMMIHEGQGVCQGDADEMRKFAETLDKHSESISGFYAAKTGTPASSWRTQMKNETWYTAQEAVNAGLADGLTTLPSVTNMAENIQKPHGDLPYADPGYLDADGEQASKSGNEGVARYPIDEEHVQAAWSYINQEKNASQYTPEQLADIKAKIKAAMKKFGHDVADNSLAQKVSSILKEIIL